MNANVTSPLERLILVVHRLGRQTSARLRPVTPNAHWRTLAILESEGPMRVGELAAASTISQPGMTRTLGELDEAGYVHRLADHGDARARVVAISDAGRAALHDWRVRLTEAIAPLFANLEAEELATLERAATLLERVVGGGSGATPTSASAARAEEHSA